MAKNQSAPKVDTKPDQDAPNPDPATIENNDITEETTVPSSDATVSENETKEGQVATESPKTVVMKAPPDASTFSTGGVIYKVEHSRVAIAVEHIGEAIAHGFERLVEEIENI